MMRLWFRLWSQTTSLGYLAAVLQGQVKDEGDLSALDTNVIVMQILDVARSSAARAAQLPCSPFNTTWREVHRCDNSSGWRCFLVRFFSRRNRCACSTQGRE